MYEEYQALCNLKNEKPLSKYMLRDVFYRKFNLRFKQPQQDTCNYCDKMKHKIDAAQLKSTERMQLIQEKDSHLQAVEYLDREFKDYLSESKLSADEKIVLVFDLEKVIEPRLL